MESLPQDHRFLKKFPLMAAILIVVACFGLILVLIRPTFDTSDDVAMIGIATGCLGTTAPSEMLVLSHVMLGRALVYLYGVWGGVPWYAICLLVTHFAAYVVLLWGLLLFSPKKSTVYGFLVFLLIVGTHFVCHFSYTTSSFLAAQSGIVILFANMSLASDRKWLYRFRAAVGLLLIVMSCLLRWESCLLVLASSIPLAIVMFWSAIGRAAVLHVGTTALVVAAVVGLTVYTDHCAYVADPKWDAYWKLHVATCGIVDYGRIQGLYRRPSQAKHILAEVQWTPNDFWLLKSWFFFDPVIYSQDKIQQVGEQWSRFQMLSSAENASVFFRETLSVLRNPICILVVLILALLSSRQAPVFATWSRRAIWILALCGMVYLAYFKKLPPRVFVPILVFASVQSVVLELFFSWRSQVHLDPVNTNALSFQLGLATLIVLGGMSVYGDVRWNRLVVANSRKFWSDITALGKPRSKMIITCSIFPFDVVTSYDDIRALRELNCFPMSIYQRSPHSRELLDQAGIENLSQAMYQDPGILFASVPQLNGAVAQFFKDHYQVNVEFEPVFQGDSGFVLYRLRSKAVAVTSHRDVQ